MITIKLPYESNQIEDILQYQQQFSSLVRSVYNRVLEGKDSIECKQYRDKLNNIELVNNTWFFSNAHIEAKRLAKIAKGNKIIFGGKYNFKQRLKNKITKEEYKYNKLLSIISIGEKNYNGNRFFKLDVINNTIIFKPNRETKIELQLPKLRKNYLKQLIQLEELSKQKQYKYTCKLTDRYITITFEPFEPFKQKQKQIELIENRFIGIDLNPSEIGISICEQNNNDFKIIETYQFNLNQITDKILKLNKSSNSKESKYLQNKLDFETYQISKRISNIAKQYQCKHIFIEDLNFGINVSNKYNHIGNRLTRNLWKRNKFIDNLNKRLSIYGIQLKSVNAAYTSYIGNFRYNYTDAINASIEVARRGYNVRILRNKQFYPTFIINSLKHQWKEMANECKDWKELSVKIKNLKVKYRVQLDDAIQQHRYAVYSLDSKKSLIKIYNLYI